MAIYRQIHQDAQWCFSVFRRGSSNDDLVLLVLVPQTGTYEIAIKLTEEEALRYIHGHTGDGEELKSFVNDLLKKRDAPEVRDRLIPFKHLNDKELEVISPELGEGGGS